MYKLYTLGLAISIIIATSCASYQGQANPDEEIFAIVSDQYATVEMVYVGATPNYHIVETHIVNHQEVPVKLSHEQFAISSTKRERDPILPYTQDEAIAALSQEQKKIKKEKKGSLVAGILVTGLTAALNAGTGLSVAENVFYTAESAIYIADENRYYNRNIKGIESEKEYIQQQVLDHEIILQGKTITKDLLFPKRRWKGKVEILYKGTHTDYILEFSAGDFRS